LDKQSNVFSFFLQNPIFDPPPLEIAAAAAVNHCSAKKMLQDRPIVAQVIE
jgi:hypothetical protein